MNDEKQINDFLSTLRADLGPISLGDREEIVREIHAHIRDSMEQTGTNATAVLKRLGTPEELAAQYRDRRLIQQASRGFSPVLLLRATFRLASRSALGILLFICALFGYAFGGGLILTSFAKCILPANTGVWVIGHTIVSSGVIFPAPQPPMHEVLGLWYIPLAFVVGCIIVLLTTFAMRGLLRASRFLRAFLSVPARVHRTALSAN